MPRQDPTRPHGHRLTAACGILLLFTILLTVPSAARSPDIQHIQPGDMIFIYETNLDISGLRTGTFLVTSLRKYQEDNPTRALLREVPVGDETSFTPIPEAFGDLLGVYYAFNATAGAMNSAVVGVPSVSIDAVLASPNHADSIQGLTIPEDTRIAFKITSVYVGSGYHAGPLYPATVDLVLTAPGGAELTTIEGRDFSGMNVSSQVFYTDDPGRPGAITLGGLGRGSFSVQARWRDPASWYNQAPDSNSLSLVVGGTTTTPTTPTPAPLTTPVTTLVTMTTVAATTPPTTPVTIPATTALPPTPPVILPSAGTPPPSPTSAPMGPWLSLLAPAMAAMAILFRKGT